MTFQPPDSVAKAPTPVPASQPKPEKLKTVAVAPAPAPKRIVPAYLPESMFADADVQKAPVVNVFGEFSKSRTRPGMAVADLGLRQHTFLNTGDADGYDA